MADTQQPDEKTQAGTAPEARRYGFPAVYAHEVCAVRTVAREDWDSSEPGRVQLLRWRAGSGVLVRDMPLNRLYVWARAGRVSFGDKAGRTVDIVLLGEPETEGLVLGTPWPSTYNRTNTASNVAHGVVADLKNTVTFPVSFPRMMRVSGERNAVLDALVGWCQREVPGIHILRGWPRGSERPTRHQVRGLPHKGLLGEPGWLPDTVGAHPAGWSPFRNDRNVEDVTARPRPHEHPSGA
ncbi:hypothetical protein [Catenulispora subtropica]|uniref:Uncharacterized protein n=1 Tax=Catenulispora subtropica TaxID=450798 RepID=A0ABN2QL19_9ACTN